MRKQRLTSKTDFEEFLADVKGDAEIYFEFIDGVTEPAKYPCMIVVAFSSPGYYEICFIYPEDIYFRPQGKYRGAYV